MHLVVPTQRGTPWCEDHTLEAEPGASLEMVRSGGLGARVSLGEVVVAELGSKAALGVDFADWGQVDWEDWEQMEGGVFARLPAGTEEEALVAMVGCIETHSTASQVDDQTCNDQDEQKCTGTF